MTAITTRSRRSVLGLLTAVPVAGGAALAGGGVSRAGGTALVTTAGAGHRVPPDLRPGGVFDRFVAERAGRDEFSGTVLLAHRGQPVLVRSHGMADQRRGVPNTSGTVYCLASVTKVFTALAVGRLAQQGRIAFHASLGTYLTGFPDETANTVTVHHLLTHTSGIGRSATGPGQPSPVDWDTLDEVIAGNLAVIRGLPPRFAAGTRYGYSNDAYLVLGAIVAQVSGVSYFDYVRRHVFGAAGMIRTAFHTRPHVLAATDIARPYATQRPAGRTDFTASPYFPFNAGPAAGAYSTVTDLLRFARALSAGALLAPAFVDLMTGGKAPLPPEERQPPSQATFYGYGHYDAIVNNHRVFGHSGSGPGMATRLDIFPDLDWVTVVLSNYDTTVDPIVTLIRDLITG